MAIPNINFKCILGIVCCCMLGSLEAKADVGYYLIRINLVGINTCERKWRVREGQVGDRLRNQTEMKTWKSLGQVDGGLWIDKHLLECPI